MINQKLLVSDAKHFSDDFKINPYYTESKIDLKKAEAEHSHVLDCFKEAGIELVQVPSPEGSQDGVYTANWAVVKDGIAIMSRLPEARKAEEDYARTCLEKLGIKCYLVPENHLFSGQGDCLICGKYQFAGRGYRSDEEAQLFVNSLLDLQLVQLHTKPQLDENGAEYVNPATKHADSFWYDLDLALSIIDEHTIAYCPEAFDEESQAKLAAIDDLDKIIIDYKECTEGFACNLVSTGKTAIMSDKAPKLQAELEKRGLKCLTPSVVELKKGGGYIRCVSLWLN